MSFTLGNGLKLLLAAVFKTVATSHATPRPRLRYPAQVARLLRRFCRATTCCTSGRSDAKDVDPTFGEIEQMRVEHGT
jgi:hypothetical protein